MSDNEQMTDVAVNPYDMKYIRCGKEDAELTTFKDIPPIYICDPNKHTECPKTNCKHNGTGDCFQTIHEEYQKRPTNQDKLAEMVRTMDIHKLALFITDSIECPNCPAEKYCDQHMFTNEDGWARVPDENGELLDCNQIFERWLKEENQMIEKYTDAKYIQGFSNVGYDFSDDYKQGYSDGRASMVEEFEKLRSELHETAEMHIDGDYYLRDEWIDEYIDNHIAELKGENNE